MNRWPGSVAILAFVIVGCGGHGATQFEGPVARPVATFGSCALCHSPMAANMVGTAADLKCQVCHADEHPGSVGPGHRAIPGMDLVPSFPGPAHLLHAEAPFGSCAFCHDQLGLNLAPYSVDLNCPLCHDDLLPGMYGPHHRAIPGPDRVPSFASPMHTLGTEAPFGTCAFCHNQLADNMVPVSADLQCDVCHDNREPGVYGPGHRAIPGPDRVPSFAGPSHQLGIEAPFGSCAFCHKQFADSMAPVSGDLQCVVCHADQRPGVFGPGHRSLPGPELVPSFAGPAHALGPQAAFGSCAFCHNEMAVNMTSSGVDVPCIFCHATALSPGYGRGHRSFPGPEQVQSFPGPAHQLVGPETRFGKCGFCHNELTVTAAASSGHGDLSLDCAQCHTDVRPNEYGPGHEIAPRCAECHTKQQTHQDPAVGTVRECTNCHTPHGSTNIFLINEQVSPPAGAARTVVFNNILGLADGSFASLTQPGTGLCETCHTRTEFYRSDGTGTVHFPYPCFTCHPHAGGFAAD